MNQQEPLKPEDFFWFDRQEITIEDFDSNGLILDIGGGGEGVIGQMKGSQVIAIDRNENELIETPKGPLKIIMDATDLKFLGGSFETITSFYCLMYLKSPYHTQVFQEVFRVLKPGGKFLVWDISILQSENPEKIGFVIPLLIHLPEKQIETGYGFRWPEIPQDTAYYKNLAIQTGFEVCKMQDSNNQIYLELQKPK